MESQKITVYMCGAHSVGKTTLIRNLQKHPQFSKFNFKDHEEVARPWIKERGLTQEEMRDPATLFEFEKEITKIQYLAEERETKENGFTRFLWDRGIIDPIGYVKAFVGDDEAEELLTLPHVKEMLGRWKRATDCLIFVVKPEKSFIEDDGLRRQCDIDDLMSLHRAMIYYLEKCGIVHTVITCVDLEERTKLVVDAVKKKWNISADQM